MSKAFKTARIATMSHWLFSFATVITVLANSSMVSNAAELFPSTSDRPSSQVVSIEQNDELTDLVEQIYRGVNEYRASLDLPPLSLNTHINQQAQIHSQNMAQQEVEFSHQGFQARVNTLALEGQIIYSHGAENVAFNQGYDTPAQIAIAEWIESTGHHKNMIGDFNLTGIGVAKNRAGEYYFTQIFIKEN
ncbi:MAG: CAP domain-containing protein [Waterburya sp.]